MKKEGYAVAGFQLKESLLEELNNKIKKYKVYKKQIYAELILSFNETLNVVYPNVDNKIQFTKESVHAITDLKEQDYKIFKENCKKLKLTTNYVFHCLVLEFLNTDLEGKYKYRISHAKQCEDNAALKGKTYNPRKMQIKTIFPKEVDQYVLKKEKEDDINKQLTTFSKTFSSYFENEECMRQCFYNIYKMRYIFKYTTGEIANCFLTRNERSVQAWLKTLKWQLDMFEVQKRIVDRGRRDYKQIRNKSKETKLQRMNSKPEEYTRQKLNVYLPQIMPDKEIVVGLNNVSILNGGSEIDIPILILSEGKIYKYAVEYNGGYWHNEDNRHKDIIKNKATKEKGYKMYIFEVFKNATENQTREEIDKQIESLCEDILRDIA